MCFIDYAKAFDKVRHQELFEDLDKMQKDICMCFIDYAKAFDKVRHQELFEDLDKLDLYRKHVCLLASLYWNQTAYI